jgi:hypothetical protein
MEVGNMSATVDRCNDIEYQKTDGTWERVGARAVPASVVCREAAHQFVFVPPRYIRCRFCGEIRDTGADL